MGEAIRSTRPGPPNKARWYAPDVNIAFYSTNTAVKKTELARIIREYAASRGWRREVAVKMLVAL
jgi:hypothetical protein